VFRFLKNLFANPYDKIADQILVEIKRNEAEKIQPDISEPVLSFVNCVKQNPKRFVLDYKEPTEQCVEGDDGCKAVIIHWRAETRIFKDLLTGEQWQYRINYSAKGNSIYGCEFLTGDEKKYILKELGDFYHKRWSRLSELRRIRRNRKNVIERDRLKGIYCQ
jgi:hypothetical protein